MSGKFVDPHHRDYRGLENYFYFRVRQHDYGMDPLDSGKSFEQGPLEFPNALAHLSGIGVRLETRASDLSTSTA